MFGDPSKLALDRAGPAEQASIHLIEIVSGCVKHETAGDTDGNSDCAAVELDCKTLCGHGKLFSRRTDANARRSKPHETNARLIE